jgi:hypothetical protein
MDTEHSAITEPVRRLEVFTGAGVGGSGATKTRHGLLQRSLRVVTRFVPWLDVMGYRRSSCLAGAAS